MKLNKITEKRTRRRHICHVPVESTAGADFDDCGITDISREGLGLVSHHSIPRSKKIIVELAFNPLAEPILVEGEVRWIFKDAHADYYRLGMQFNKVLSGKKSSLQRYFTA